MRPTLLPLAMIAAIGAHAWSAEPPPPVLGVTLEDPGSFDPGQGVVVTGITAASSFDHAGVRVGDHLLKINDRAIAKVDDVAAAARTLKVGGELRVTVLRGAETVALTGTVEKMARPRELSQQTAELTDEIAQLRALAERHPGGKLEQALALLKQFEADLPKAAAEFKAEYPEGEFKISIHIDISSKRQDAAPAPAAAPPAPVDAAPAKP
jgi:hypothetical protein